MEFPQATDLAVFGYLAHLGKANVFFPADQREDSFFLTVTLYSQKPTFLYFSSSLLLYTSYQNKAKKCYCLIAPSAC